MGLMLRQRLGLRLFMHVHPHTRMHAVRGAYTCTGVHTRAQDARTMHLLKICEEKVATPGLACTCGTA